VVLNPFPITDLQGAKVRPAVVVSRSDRAGDDVVLAFISSVKPPKLFPTDLVLLPSHPDFAATGLKAESGDAAASSVSR
jgi:mRNA interferase MazF